MATPIDLKEALQQNIPWVGLKNLKQTAINNGFDENSWNKLLKQTSATNQASSYNEEFNSGLDTGNRKLDSILSKYQKLFSTGTSGEIKLKALRDIGIEALEKEDKIRKQIIQNVGQVGALQRIQSENIFKASIEAQRYGLDLDDVLSTSRQITKELGRGQIISEEDIARATIFGEAMGLSEYSVAEMIKGFDQMGYSIETAIDKGNEMATVARQMGVNTGDFIETIAGKMDMMNTYNFSDGVRGFARMAAQAQKLGISMSTTASLAEKVMDPEGAIELAANLQVLGGAAGDLADPFKLMYMATNDLEGLQNSLVQAGQELAVFNEETGEISFPPTAQRQLRAMADVLGMNKEELASMIKLQTKFQSMQNQFSLDLQAEEGLQDFVTSIASLNEDGKYEVKLEGGAVELEDLGSEQIEELKKLREEQAELDRTSEKDLLIQQNGILDNIANALLSGEAAIQFGITEGINSDELTTTFNKAISKAFSSGELTELGESMAGFIKTGIESVFGTSTEGISGMASDSTNFMQAFLGTGVSSISDLFKNMTNANIELQQADLNVTNLNIKGKDVNDFQLSQGEAKAVLTDGGFLLPSVNDTVTGVDLTAGAKGTNIGPLIGSTMGVPEKTVNVKFSGMPSKIPLELNGVNMGDFNWRALLGNSLFMQYLKSALIDTNLTTALDFNNENQTSRYFNMDGDTFG